jgi:hypothetical protein
MRSNPRAAAAMRGLAAALVAACATAACTFLADFEGLTEDPSGPAGGGAASAGTDASGTHSGSGGSGACAGASLCDDFEGSALNDRWIPNTITGTVEIDATRFHAGRSALRMNLLSVEADDYGQAFIANSDTLSPSAARHYARAWFFIAANYSHLIHLFSLGQAAEPWKSLTLGATPAGNLHISSSVAAASELDLSTSIRLGDWFCLEWQVDLKDPQQVRIWFDGDELSDFNRLQPTQPDPPMGFFNMGPQVYYPGAPTPDFEMWIDDVVIGDERIGCD